MHNVPIRWRCDFMQAASGAGGSFGQAAAVTAAQAFTAANYSEVQLWGQ